MRTRSLKVIDMAVHEVATTTADQTIEACALQMRRDGIIGEITVTDMRWEALKSLENSESIKRSFPDQTFHTFPHTQTECGPDAYKRVLANAKPYQITAIALPDQLHYQAIKGVLQFNQHILCVKPLVLKYSVLVNI